MSSLVSNQILSETYPSGHAMRSRYIRVAQALEWYPFKRAKLYELLASGKIKSFLLKERGAIRGLRLIDRDSLDEFLQTAAEGAEGKASI
jgi:hypothetical protein